MIQEEKQILLIDICARLPYGVKIKTPRGIYTVDAVSSKWLFSIPNDDKTLDDLTPHDGHYWLPITDDYKPYLRPMSSMSKKERALYFAMDEDSVTCVDWLNAHNFDYRGLIEKGLALEAPEEMY